MTDEERAERERLALLADEEDRRERERRDAQSLADELERKAAEDAVRIARYALRERCGESETTFALGSESIGEIGPMLRLLLNCVDALEKRVRELEPPKRP